MYIDIVPNRKSPPAVLLRESHCVKGKTVKKTIANLSKCPPDVIEVLRLALKGVELAPKDEIIAIERSLPHGHVQAVLGVMRKLGIDNLLSSQPCKQRDLVMAMMAQRLLKPCSKLATSRSWSASTLSQELNIADADENDLYEALDWLLKRQERIENKLAKRHLREGACVLYDVSSSSYYGHACPLAKRGYNRDGLRIPSIVYGLMTDSEGRPIAIQVYAGNTADPKTIPDQVEKLRHRFGLERIVLVGDRGMLTQAQINTLREYPQLGWISALRSSAINKLILHGDVQLSLFDQQNLSEIHSDLYPGERLMVCFNPYLAQDRKMTREALIVATEKRLQKIVAEVGRRKNKILTAEEISLKVGRVSNSHKVAKHLVFDIRDGHFSFHRDEDRIAQEAHLDGIYIIRTGETAEAISSAQTVRTYKSLGQVEQAFRSIKGVDLLIRPIFHRTEDHVRAHVFLTTLAYYVEWHMRRALAPVLFEDEDLPDTRWLRDPVGKAQTSPKVKSKRSKKKTDQGWPVHSFSSLLSQMGTLCRNTCRVDTGKGKAVRFERLTDPTLFQEHVFELLGLKHKKKDAQ